MLMLSSWRIQVHVCLCFMTQNTAILTYPELMNQISSVWHRLASPPPHRNFKIPPVGSEPTARNAFDPSAEINQAQGLAFQAPSNTNSNLLNVRPELQTGIYNVFDPIPQTHQANTNRQRFPTSELSSAYPGLASKTHSNTNYKIPRIEKPVNDDYDSESEISQYLESAKHLQASNVSSVCPELSFFNSFVQKPQTTNSRI